MSRFRAALTTAFAVALFGCSGDPAGDPSLEVIPSGGSSFGYQRVRILLSGVDITDVSEVEVEVGGIRAIELAADPEGGVQATVQGSPTPGPVDIKMTWKGHSYRAGGGYHYEEPTEPSLTNWMAIGASITQGVQSAGLSPRSQQMSPASQIARAAGAYLGLALIRPELLPPFTADQFGPDCELPESNLDIDGLLDLITNPETGDVELARGRLDPNLPLRNLAVGGSRLHHLVSGGDGFLTIFENLVLNPLAAGDEWLYQSPQTQVDLVEEIHPDIVVCFDTYFNDIGDTVMGQDDIDVDKATPLDRFVEAAETLAERVAAAAGHAFFANLPRVNFLPRIEELKEIRLAAGESEEAFRAKVDEVNERINAFNTAFAQAIAPYSNLHIVDIASRIDELLADGLVAGGQRLTMDPFGGIFSLDHTHLSDVGSAIYANVFIRSINATLGTNIPNVNLDEVIEEDPSAPENLREYPQMQQCVPPEAGYF